MLEMTMPYLIGACCTGLLCLGLAGAVKGLNSVEKVLNDWVDGKYGED